MVLATRYLFCHWKQNTLQILPNNYKSVTGEEWKYIIKYNFRPINNTFNSFVSFQQTQNLQHQLKSKFQSERKYDEHIRNSNLE